MSFNYSSTTIIGHVGADPEMRYTPSGNAVVNFNVAVSHQYKGGNGELNSDTTWYRAVCWNKTGDVAHKYLRKGDPVMLVGRISLNQWTGQDGTTRASIEMNVSTLQLISSRERASEGGEFAPASQGAVEVPGDAEALPW